MIYPERPHERPCPIWAAILGDLFGVYVVRDCGVWESGLRSWLLRVELIKSPYTVHVCVPDDNSFIRLSAHNGACIEITLTDADAYARLRAVTRQCCPFLMSLEDQRKIMTG